MPSGGSGVAIGRGAPQAIRQASESICSSSLIGVLDRAEVGCDKVCFFLCKQRVLCWRKDRCQRGGSDWGWGQRLKYPRHAWRKKRGILRLHTVHTWVYIMYVHCNYKHCLKNVFSNKTTGFKPCWECWNCTNPEAGSQSWEWCHTRVDCIPVKFRNRDGHC